MLTKEIAEAAPEDNIVVEDVDGDDYKTSRYTHVP